MSNQGKYRIVVVLLAAAAVAALSSCGGGGNTAAWPSGTPQISVADSVAPADDLQVPFGTVDSGSSSVQALLIGNSGKGNLAIGDIAAGHTLAGPFTVALDICSGRTLQPGGSCFMLLRFAPTTAGPASDSLAIPSNDPATPVVTVSVSGSGGASPSAPHISVTDSVAPADDRIVFFGNVNLNASAAQAFTVSNVGTANLTIGQIGQGYRLEGPFSLADGCSNVSLAPSQSCVITVTFTPSAAGDYAGGFDIPSNDASGSVLVGVGGTGVDLISPAKIAFGAVAANATADQDVTVTNNASGDIVIGDVALIDPLSAPFSIVSDGCSQQTLSVGGSCIVTVRFAPTTDGSYADSFDVPTSGAISGDFSVKVSGASGSGTVAGTITLPSAVTSKCYSIVISTSFGSGIVGTATGEVTGSQIVYSIPNITPGQYYLYAGVDNDGSSATPPACNFSNMTPTPGDFGGFYGGGYPSSPNIVVSTGTNTFDFRLQAY